MVEQRDLDNLKRDFAEFKRQLTPKIDEILTAIVGDRLGESGGLVREMKTIKENQKLMEEDISELKEHANQVTNKFDQAKAFGFGLFLAGGIIGFLLTYIFNHHFKQ